MVAFQSAWDSDPNMGFYQVVLFASLALVLQCHQLNANDCKRRTTFIQIRIPQRTHVAVKYPKEISSVQYVPFPYMSTGSQCIKCQDASCQKCTYTKPQTYSTANARKTNIIIDIKGTRKLNATTTDTANNANNTGTVDGTIVGIYDRTSAASKSGASASTDNKGNSSAASASGTSLSQINTLAALNEEEVNKENGERSRVEDIYAVSEDGSTADANSTAAGDPEKKDKPNTSKPGKNGESGDKKPSNGGKDEKGSPAPTPDKKKAVDGASDKTKDVASDKAPEDPSSPSSDPAKSAPTDTSNKAAGDSESPEPKSPLDTDKKSSDAENPDASTAPHIPEAAASSTTTGSK